MSDQLTDSILLAKLSRVAREQFDGHLTVMRFTPNWRIAFGESASRSDIDAMPLGKTFAEAATVALSGVADSQTEQPEDAGAKEANPHGP
jgi:hypothetical protein